MRPATSIARAKRRARRAGRRVGGPLLQKPVAVRWAQPHKQPPALHGQQVRGQRRKGNPTRRRRVTKRRMSTLQQRRHHRYERHARSVALRSAELERQRTGAPLRPVGKAKRKRWLRRG